LQRALVALQFGMLLGRRQHDRATGAIDLLRQLEAAFVRMAEELLQHRHHVLVGMIVVVPEDHVIPRLPARR